MATPTTAAAVPILRDRAVLATDVPALAFKVIRMASSTIRLERRRAVVDCLGIALVALGALEVAAMIKWLIRQACVTVVVRCPPVGCMTKVTFLRRHKVISVLASRNRTVVARRARTQDLVMVHHGYRRERDRRMAGLAQVGS